MVITDKVDVFAIIAPHNYFILDGDTYHNDSVYKLDLLDDEWETCPHLTKVEPTEVPAEAEWHSTEYSLSEVYPHPILEASPWLVRLRDQLEANTFYGIMWFIQQIINCAWDPVENQYDPDKLDEIELQYTRWTSWLYSLVQMTAPPLLDVAIRGSLQVLHECNQSVAYMSNVKDVTYTDMEDINQIVDEWNVKYPEHPITNSQIPHGINRMVVRTHLVHDEGVAIHLFGDDFNNVPDLNMLIEKCHIHGVEAFSLPSSVQVGDKIVSGFYMLQMNPEAPVFTWMSIESAKKLQEALQGRTTSIEDVNQ